MKVISFKKLFVFIVTIFVLGFVVAGCIFFKDIPVLLVVVFFLIAIGLSIVNLIVLREIRKTGNIKIECFLYETFFTVLIFLTVLHLATGFNIFTVNTLENIVAKVLQYSNFN